VRPWLDTLVDLLKKMLRYEPSARIRPKAALEHDFFRDLGDPDAEDATPAADCEEAGPASREEEVIVLED
jgi:serine/threonine protein kinase